MTIRTMEDAKLLIKSNKDSSSEIKTGNVNLKEYTMVIHIVTLLQKRWTIVKYLSFHIDEEL